MDRMITADLSPSFSGDGAIGISLRLQEALRHGDKVAVNHAYKQLCAMAERHNVHRSPVYSDRDSKWSDH